MTSTDAELPEGAVPGAAGDDPAQAAGDADPAHAAASADPALDATTRAHDPAPDIAMAAGKPTIRVAGLLVREGRIF